MNMMEKTSAIKKNIQLKDGRSVYYLVLALRNLAMGFISATYVLFLFSHGLNSLQVNLVNTAFMVGNFVFEIPTGVYADFFGRKNSYLIHCFLLAASFFIYFFSKSFAFFVLAEIVAALAFTFASGALDAWLVDNIGEDWVTRTDYVFSQAEIFSKFALIVGGIAGGYLGSINLAYPWLVAGLIAVASFFIANSFMEERFERKGEMNFVGGLKQMNRIAKDSFSYGFQHRVVLWLVISTFVSFYAFQPLNMFWAPRFNQMTGGKIWLMGWLWALMAFFMILGSYLSRRLIEKGIAYWKIMVLTSIFLSLPIIFSSLSTTFSLAVAGFLFYEIGRGLDTPMKRSYINKYIPSDKRATLISFDSMVGRLAASLGLVIFGFIAKQTSFATSWLAAGFVMLFLIPVYLKVREKEKQI